MSIATAAATTQTRQYSSSSASEADTRNTGVFVASSSPSSYQQEEPTSIDRPTEESSPLAPPELAVSSAGTPNGSANDVVVEIQQRKQFYNPVISIGPVGKMMLSWLLAIITPSALVAWAFTKQWTAVLAATLMTPAVAIMQGAILILRYRVNFGDAPLPITPSHGVVLVNTVDKHIHEQNRQKHKRERREKRSKNRPQDAESNGSCTSDESTATRLTDLSSGSDPHRLQTLHESMVQEDESQQNSNGYASSSPPLRLLVIGDSLAIGVGQSQSCTPIMPEVIAKTLSKEMGGRVVYWTCHGAPGASAGWIVRELERGVNYTQRLQQREEDGRVGGDEEDDNDDNRTSSSALVDDDSDASSYDALREPLSVGVVELQSSCSETEDDLSSDEDSCNGDADTRRGLKHRGARAQRTRGAAPVVDSMLTVECQSMATWKERLIQHGKRFNPDVLGPYDVVVILTGSNDLKSAFFPFLLTGEDAEFRRQAQERGGSYFNELRRLFETLHRKMRTKVQTLRESVEAVRDTVRERVEETIDRIAPHRVSSTTRRSSSGSDRSTLSSKQAASAVQNEEEMQGRNAEASSGLNFPLVVLPGMPARAIPIFHHIPLRWLAVPVVDIMDTHKRKLAASHPGQVQFIKPPAPTDLAAYHNEIGPFYDQKCKEDTLLSLRDVKKQDCRRIEGEMREYYRRKDGGRDQDHGHGRISGGAQQGGGGRTVSRRRRRHRSNASGRISSRESNVTPTIASDASSTASPSNGMFSSGRWCSGGGWYGAWRRRRAAALAAHKLFSIDHVHPRDEGYDFWGRYIGTAIVEELKQQHQLNEQQHLRQDEHMQNPEQSHLVGTTVDSADERV